MPRRASRTGKGSKSSKTARVLGLLTNPGNVEEDAAGSPPEQTDDMDDRAAQAEIRSALEQELLGLLPNGGLTPAPEGGADAYAPSSVPPSPAPTPEDADATARSAYDALLSAADDDWDDAPAFTEEGHGRGRGSRHRRKQREQETGPEAPSAVDALSAPDPDAHEPAQEPEALSRPAPDVYEPAPEPEEPSHPVPDTYEPAPEPEEPSHPVPDVYESAPEPEGPSRPVPDGYESAPEPEGPSYPVPDVYESAPEPEEPSHPMPDVYESAPEPGENSSLSKENLFASAPKPVSAPVPDQPHTVHEWTPPRAEDRENLVSGHPEEWICFNLTQALVDEKTEKYMRLFGMCTCARCKVDVTAIALTNLPVKYVATQNRDVVPLLSMYEQKYSADVVSQVVSACKKVMTRPHHGRH